MGVIVIFITYQAFKIIDQEICRSWDSFIFLFNYKARDNTNKKITIYSVVWTCLTRAGCFNWLAHYKRMRIVNKYMGVHCTVNILNITLMINQKIGKEAVKRFKRKGRYSAEGLEHILLESYLWTGWRK